MTTYDKLVSEYEQISRTDFWKVYQDRIKHYRLLLSRQCEQEDDPRRSQGAIVAIDYVLGKNERKSLAEQILVDLKNAKPAKGAF